MAGANLWEKNPLSPHLGLCSNPSSDLSYPQCQNSPLSKSPPAASYNSPAGEDCPARHIKSPAGISLNRKISPPVEGYAALHKAPPDEICAARHNSPLAQSYPAPPNSSPIENYVAGHNSPPPGLSGDCILSDIECDISDKDNMKLLTADHSPSDEAVAVSRPSDRLSSARQSIPGPSLTASPTQESQQERIFFSLPKKSQSFTSHQCRILQDSRRQHCSFHTFKAPPLSGASPASGQQARADGAIAPWQREELRLSAAEKRQESPALSTSISLGFATLPSANFFCTGINSPPMSPVARTTPRLVSP